MKINPPMSITTAIIVSIVFFLLFTSLWGIYNSIRPTKFLSHITPKDLGLAYEEVKFKTEDGLTLAGWFVPLKSRAEGAADANGVLPLTGQVRTIILLHGYPADKGDILPSLAFLSQNYNLFLFDFRYLGQSEGFYSTAGIKEVKDLKAAIEYLKSRGITEVGVWGFSMGGAVALTAAPTNPEIKVIVSESSYARLDLLAPELYRVPVLKQILGKLTVFWGKIFLRVDVKKESPLEAAKKLKIPILLIHSLNDEVISFRHASLLQDALKENPRAEFWFQENLFHGELDPEYKERVANFFDRSL